MRIKILGNRNFRKAQYFQIDEEKTKVDVSGKRIAVFKDIPLTIKFNFVESNVLKSVDYTINGFHTKSDDTIIETYENYNFKKGEKIVIGNESSLITEIQKISNNFSRRDFRNEPIKTILTLS